MSTFLNEKMEPLTKEDLSYEIIDGKFEQVYKPCICIYKVIYKFLFKFLKKNCGKRFKDSFELDKHLKSHLE